MLEGFPLDAIGGSTTSRADRPALALEREPPIAPDAAPRAAGPLGCAPSPAVPAFAELLAPLGGPPQRSTEAESSAAEPAGVPSGAAFSDSMAVAREGREPAIEQYVAGYILSEIETGRRISPSAPTALEHAVDSSNAVAAVTGTAAVGLAFGTADSRARDVERAASSDARAGPTDAASPPQRAAAGTAASTLRASPMIGSDGAPGGSVSPPSGDVLPLRQPRALADPVVTARRFISTWGSTWGSMRGSMRGSMPIDSGMRALEAGTATIADAAASASLAASNRARHSGIEHTTRFGVQPRRIAAAESRAIAAGEARAIAATLPTEAAGDAASAPMALAAPSDAAAARARARVDAFESPESTSREDAAHVGRGNDRAMRSRDAVEAPLPFGVESLRDRGAADARAAMPPLLQTRFDAPASAPSGFAASTSAATATTAFADGSRSAGAHGYAVPLPLPAGGAGDALGVALGHRLIALARNGEQRARIALHPAELGAIDIRINLRDEAATVAITAQQPHARELIEAGIPRLRELFAEQGLSLVDVDVSGQRDGGTGRAAELAASSALRAAGARAQLALGNVEPAPDSPARGNGARLLDVLA